MRNRVLPIALLAVGALLVTAPAAHAVLDPSAMIGCLTAVPADLAGTVDPAALAEPATLLEPAALVPAEVPGAACLSPAP
jgi:CelD/BcsL family acetyltransferase involved in cellulose biosynthesis